MSLKIKLLLPPNYNNTFLLNEVVNEGQTYFTGKASLSPDLDTNGVSLKFGIQLADTDTREEVSVRTIEYIRLSNDPNFTGSSTITILGFPYAAGDTDPTHYVTNSGKNFIVNLNPAAFFDPDNESLELSRTEENGGDDLFIINNWPLSANGGLSTVYYRISVFAVGIADPGTYPNSLGAYDQIFWQPEKTVHPGTPSIISKNEDYTGPRSLWRFAASNEAATGLYGTGISRYIGDIVEVRGPEYGSDDYNIFNYNNSTRRNIVPSFTGHTIFDCTKYNFNPTTRAYTADGSLTTNSAQSYSLSSNEGVALYSLETCAVATHQPDCFAQAHVRVSFDNDQYTHFAVSLRINVDGHDEATNSGTCEEIELKVEYDSQNLIDFPRSDLSIRLDDTSGYDHVEAGTKRQRSKLPYEVIDFLRDGCLLELYYSDFKRPKDPITTSEFDSKRIIKAYLSKSDKSYLLGSFVTANQFYTGDIQANVLFECIEDPAIFQFSDLSFGTGRILLDVDLGDCKFDDVQVDNFASTKTALDGWQTAITNGTWKYLGYNNGTYSINSGTGYRFTSPVQQGQGRSYSELMAYMPTFSDRCKIDFTMRQLTGEFYVALSPNPVFHAVQVGNAIYDPYEDKPMGWRCESLDAELDTYINKPTLMVVFDNDNQTISLVQRKIDNSLVTKILCPYAYPVSDTDGENWSLIVSDEYENSPGNGTFVILKRNTDVIGVASIELPLPSARFGMGWYVSFGTRSQENYSFLKNHVSGFSINATEPTPAIGDTYLRTVSIVGLAPKRSFHSYDLEQQRHFLKASAGASYMKPLLGQQLLAGNTEFRDFALESVNYPYTYFVQKFQVTSSSSESKVHPQLVEFMLIETDMEFNANQKPASPSVRFYEDRNGNLGTSLTDWLSPLPETLSSTNLPPIASPGFKVSNNKLVQFGLKNTNVPEMVPGRYYWLALRLPKGLAAARANGPRGFSSEIYLDGFGSLLTGATENETGTGWISIPSMYFKLFHAYRERHDNVFHKASIQARVTAESHARIKSDPSNISDPVKVDIDGPQYLTTGRPRLVTQLKPGVRTTILNIQVSDSVSGLRAFRIGRETDHGRVIYTDWQQWAAFSTSASEAQYTIYHYGSWWLDEYGEADTYISGSTAQNLGTDGPRKIWVQVIDIVGNISESYPVTVNAQLIALVDTTQPTAGLDVIDNAGTAIDFTKTSSVNLNVSASDVISDVKDMRFRLVNGEGIGSWTNFQQYTNVITKSIVGTGTTSQLDGIKRIEVQVRDYGNNISQPESIYDNILAATFTEDGDIYDRNVLVNNSIKWTMPNSTIEKVYMSAIKTDSYTDIDLIDSRDPSYDSGTAYYGQSTEDDSYYRKIYFRDSDDITLTVNGTGWNKSDSSGSGFGSNRYYIDDDKGLLVFYDTLPASPVFVCNVVRSSALIYSWDNIAVRKIADLGIRGEKVILSMAALTNSILLGTGSGNIWKFDGYDITGPIFTATDDSGVALPVSVLHVNQFEYETVPYIYAGTSIKSYIFRSSEANLENDWESIAAVAPSFAVSGEPYDLTCAESVYDAIFFGTKQGFVIKYTRERANTNSDTTIVEDTSQLSLNHSKIDEFEPNILPVSCLFAADNQLLAGIGDRPEIFSYSQYLKDNPSVRHEVAGPTGIWSTINFDKDWFYSHAPWQFYNNGRTDTRGSSVATLLTTEDSHSEYGYRDCVQIAGASAQTHNFTYEDGSDWEQAVSNETMYTVDFTMKHVSGTGSQGFEIYDGRYYIDVQLTSSTVTATSGSVSTTKALMPSLQVVTPYDVSQQIYPDKGVIKMWNFSTSTTQDTNALYPGSGTGVTQGWVAIEFASTSVISEFETLGTQSGTSHSLRIAPYSTGTPLVGTYNNTAFTVDSHSILLVRMRMNPLASYFAPTSILKLAWSEYGSPAEFLDYQWVEHAITYSSDYVTYVFRPTWSGQIRSMFLKVEDIPENNRPNIDIDYIAVITETGYSDVTRDLTSVRVAVDGRNIRVWVGKTIHPIIEQENFLSLETDLLQLRFGKTKINEAASTWLYSDLKYAVGIDIGPVSIDSKPFSCAYRFPSSGGVRKLVSHQGSVWALTDGYYTFKIADNPDDHAFKVWSYIPEEETWRYEDPSTPRFTGGIGIVRPLAAVSYDDNLLISGHRGNIANQKTIPTA